MPLRFPRPVMPVIATVIAAVWVVAGNAPAFADQVRSQEWWLSALDVSPAWQAARGGGVTVAVLSDGVDAAHADLAGAVTIGPDFTNSGETTSTFVGLQGTAIASLIAGRGHGAGRAAGIVGVAPLARVLSVRVTLDPDDPAMDHVAVGAGLPDAIANGIRYAVAHHARVIDLPADPGQPSPAQVAALPIPPRQTTAPELAGITAAAGGSTAERAAVVYAEHKGVVLVAPAGDNGAGTDAANFPAAYPGVIAVGAVGQNLLPAVYSSRQPYVALTAGGSNVAAATPGGYTVVNSTSAASAMVSGIAALIRSRFPALSAAQVTSALTSSAVFEPSRAASSGSGSGTADAGRALVAAAAMAAPASERAGAGAVTWAAPAAPSVAPVASAGLAPRVLRAALISAAALILLLLLVIVYAATRRRKERREARDARVSADWVRSTQNAYSPYGSDQADQMVEYFAAADSPPGLADPFASFPGAQAAEPGPVEALFADTQVAAGVAGTGTLAGAGSSGPAVGSREVGTWVPLGAPSRAQSRPPVSGAPPWEPAAEPDSELPWAAVPGSPAGAARIRPAVSAGQASDSIWPSNVPVAPPSSPSGSSDGETWDDLVARASPALDAGRAATPAPVRPASGEHAPAGGPAAAAFTPLAPATSGPADSPGLVGSLWQARAAPRSPSGSDWESSDEPGRHPAAGESPDWPQAGSDAYREPAAGEVRWQPSGGQAGWQRAGQVAPAASSGEAWAAGQGRAAGQAWGPVGAPSAGESRDAAGAGSAGPDESASDETAWDAGGGSSPHWLAAAVSERWQPGQRGQRQPATGPLWSSPADPFAAGPSVAGPAAAGPPATDPAATDPPATEPSREAAGAGALQWGTQPGPQRDSAPWDSALGSRQWGTPAQSAAQPGRSPSQQRESPGAGSAWGAATADSAWNTTAEPSWDPSATRQHRDPAPGAGESPAGADQDELNSWRPSAATETFPAVDDD